MNMEYRSPLGCNFKLEQSLIASNGERSRETPKKDDVVISDSCGSKKFLDSDNRRNSGGGSKNYSPAWQRHSNNWKSPNFRNSQQDEPLPVEQFYHPSMLENPWEELEKPLDSS